MNEVIKNMEERRSVRGYKPDMIRKEDLDTILKPENMIKPVNLDIHPNH